MPFTFAAPLGSAIASILAKKGPAVYVVILSGVLQTIGFALLASVPVSTSVPARVYGFQVIAGFGCGINISTLLLLVPFVVEYRDKGEQILRPSEYAADEQSCRYGRCDPITNHGWSYRARNCDFGIQQLHQPPACRVLITLQYHQRRDLFDSGSGKVEYPGSRDSTDDLGSGIQQANDRFKCFCRSTNSNIVFTMAKRAYQGIGQSRATLLLGVDSSFNLFTSSCPLNCSPQHPYRLLYPFLRLRPRHHMPQTMHILLRRLLKT